jgi:DNA-binding response OmpR family regulator
MIILCEDDADQRLALRLALELAGYSVREAANGHEALSLQREQPASFLITDLYMPEADGFELMNELQKEFPATKIIVISAGGSKRSSNVLASARLIGADAALQKPFKVTELLETLEALKNR